jgi:formate hydrogenlyase subunit 3/multisubunit Na+/H+ antiporter MnhD subunit
MPEQLTFWHAFWIFLIVRTIFSGTDTTEADRMTGITKVKKLQTIGTARIIATWIVIGLTYWLYF